jgi:hypothetical protein
MFFLREMSLVSKPKWACVKNCIVEAFHREIRSCFVGQDAIRIQRCTVLFTGARHTTLGPNEPSHESPNTPVPLFEYDNTLLLPVWWIRYYVLGDPWFNSWVWNYCMVHSTCRDDSRSAGQEIPNAWLPLCPQKPASAGRYPQPLRSVHTPPPLHPISLRSVLDKVVIVLN